MHERYVIAATYAAEWQAAIAQETLLAAGIPCVLDGAYTGSFRAEAPGRVKLLVHAHDLERAEEAIRRRREEAQTIDWSQVDLGGESDADGDGDGDGDGGD